MSDTKRDTRVEIARAMESEYGAKPTLVIRLADLVEELEAVLSSLENDDNTAVVEFASWYSHGSENISLAVAYWGEQFESGLASSTEPFSHYRTDMRENQIGYTGIGKLYTEKKLAHYASHLRGELDDVPQDSVHNAYIVYSTDGRIDGSGEDWGRTLYATVCYIDTSKQRAEYMRLKSKFEN